MRQTIQDDVIAGPNQSSNNAITGGPTGGIKDSVFEIEELGNRPF